MQSEHRAEQAYVPHQGHGLRLSVMVSLMYKSVSGDTCACRVISLCGVHKVRFCGHPV